MSEKKDIFFKLFASCIPVKGIRKSIIYDLQRAEVYEISNSIYDILPIVETYNIDLIKIENPELFQFINKLVNDEIGFFCKEPTRFPKLDTKWQTPNIISNTIIEFSNNSNHNLNLIFKNLNKLSTKNVLLIFNYVPSKIYILEILNIATESNIDYIELWLPRKIKTKNLIRQYKNLRKIVFLKSKKILEVHRNQCIIKYSEFSSHKDLCKKTPLKYNLHQIYYNESLNYNTCLNKKLSIDKNRKIKNCPYLDKDFGDYTHNSIIETVKSKEFQKLWKLSKDKINECKDCQYRYMCNDCRVFTVNNNIKNKPIFCDFNPYENIKKKI